MSDDFEPDNVLTLPCSCAGCCTIARFDSFKWDDGDPPEVDVEFYTDQTDWTLGHRLKRAWDAIRGKKAWGHCLALDISEIRALRAYCDKVLTTDD